MNTTVNYLGLELKNPLVAAASPLCNTVSSAKALEDAGVSAVTIHSLFEEEINHELQEVDSMLFNGKDSFAEALSFFPDNEFTNFSVDGYIDHIKELKKALDIPVIASLNGISKGGWLDYAKDIEDAGADALELNIHYPVVSVHIDSATIESIYKDIIGFVRDTIGIPFTVKVTQGFSSISNMCKQFEEAGANGVTLFNRFYTPDIDLEKLEWESKLYQSTKEDFSNTLRAIARLYGQVKLDIAASGGITSGQDLIKAVMAGANVAQVATILLQEGVGAASRILSEANRWMEENEYESYDQMRGSISLRSAPNPEALERANYYHNYSAQKNL